ncbi:hypothetical protein BS50DRAFT_277018 [Corynespora cassiicola Philippines]|uniref:Uncharacterized protein n=1 Tax=Corynespora cassiicola Philippines TaxID=1448308 RepID=A0A2T2P0K7_CORCC|nr:hypothetical protein BS50DRAFT_277018 [Corynespora cassiicola Philippines]
MAEGTALDFILYELTTLTNLAAGILFPDPALQAVEADYLALVARNPIAAALHPCSSVARPASPFNARRNPGLPRVRPAEAAVRVTVRRHEDHSTAKFRRILTLVLIEPDRRPDEGTFEALEREFGIGGCAVGHGSAATACMEGAETRVRVDIQFERCFGGSQGLR